MTSQGSPAARLKRAIKTHNLNIIRAAAMEVERVELVDALAIVLVIREQQPQGYERAAVRWLHRYALEMPGVGLADLERAATALSVADGTAILGLLAR